MVLPERVEGMEKLLLRRVASGDELNVVYAEDIGGAVLVAELRGGLLGNRVDHLVGEVLALQIENPELGAGFLYVIGDSVEQVGLADAARTVDEERVIGVGIGVRLAGGLVRDGDRGGVGELV